MTVTDVLTTGAEVIIKEKWKLIGQFFCDVICCKTQLAFVSCDWSVPIRW